MPSTASTTGMEGTILANRSDSRRRELDFYPTPPEATKALLDFLQLPAGTVVWEPACGDGAMSDVLETYKYSVISTDLRDTGFGEGGVDFLAAEARACDAIITNPPFNISAQFIERACGIAPLVAMLLKSQYWHAAKRLELFNRLPPAWVLPLTWRPDFMGGERGGAPTMEVHWTVWDRSVSDGAVYRPLARPN